MFDSTALAAAEALLERCRARGVMLATAESCTGGLIAACLTAVAGSSDVVERGFVTYSDQAKTELLGLPSDLILGHGAVSAAVASAMAEGALKHSHADFAVSVTGIAGPGGGSAEKPVGLVYFGLAGPRGETSHDRRIFPGNRAAVRAASLNHALALLYERVGKGS